MDSSVGSPSQDQTAEDLLRHPRGAFRTDWPPAAMGGNVRIGIPDGERKLVFKDIEKRTDSSSSVIQVKRSGLPGLDGWTVTA